GAVVFSLIMRNLLTVMQILMWSHIFLIGTGRGLKETFSHYIYMIPESSFKKIIWSNLEVVIKSFTEGAVIFTVCGIILKENPLMIISCIVAFTLFSFTILGINYVFMRFTGANVSAGILMMAYFFAVLIVIVPGAVLAFVTGIAIGGKTGVITGILILSLWELLTGAGCFALSKGVLHNCDMAVLKRGK
ncbi:MAG: putative ABC exporter domain-containing protein, partial [Treponema sp.]|nr:putative ABC exporter domain-containing protein [Treponema sp.]